MRRQVAIAGACGLLMGSALLVDAGGIAQKEPLRTAPLFSVTADDFWLNLHHFLYVVGRAQNRERDATLPAVATAPDDHQAGLAALGEAERATWTDMVDAYARDLSRQPSVLVAPLAPLSIALASLGHADALPLDPRTSNVRATLERAASAYRHAWWPRHRTMNVAYAKALQDLLERDGPAMHAFLTRVYGIPWSDRPYPAHIVAYATPQGAFSIGDSVLVLSSTPYAENAGLYPLEFAFHEAMHQWDQRVLTLLHAQGKARGLGVPRDLVHALVFFTAGEAVRRLHPAHRPLLDALNIWPLRLSGSTEPAERLRIPLQEIWQPYLDGRGSRDDALGALVARTGTPLAM